MEGGIGIVAMTGVELLVVVEDFVVARGGDEGEGF